MSDLHRHLAYCESHPQDKLAARSLAEHLAEAHGWSYERSLRETVTLLRPSRDAAWITAASRKARRGSQCSRLVLATCCEDAHVSCYSNARVFFVRGFTFPRTVELDVVPGAQRFLGLVVAVGAREYLRRYRQMQHDLRLIDPARRRQHYLVY